MIELYFKFDLQVQLLDYSWIDAAWQRRGGKTFQKLLQMQLFSIDGFLWTVVYYNSTIMGERSGLLTAMSTVAIDCGL